MDAQRVPSAAIYAGSLARTYAYRTTGVREPPRLRWSFSPPAGEQITCPLLVAHQAVYVADSAGFFSALNALSGDLRWTFSTEQGKGPRGWTRSVDHFTSITAVCLAGPLGYVVAAKSTLYKGYADFTMSLLTEIELASGQASHAWDSEALLVEGSYALRDDLMFFDGLSRYGDLLFLSTPVQTFGFSPAAEGFVGASLALGTWPNNRILTLYEDRTGGHGVVFGFSTGDSLSGFLGAADEAQFVAIDLTGYGTPDTRTAAYDSMYERIRWRAEAAHIHGADVSGEESAFPPSLLHGWGQYSSGKSGAGCNQTIMDGTLYAVGWQQEESDAVGVVAVKAPAYLGCDLFVLALDPWSGATHWRCSCPTEDPPIQLAADDQLLFVVSPHQVVAVAVATHLPQWQWPVEFEVRQVLIADGRLYVLGARGQIIARDVHTGTVRWTWQVEGEVVKPFSTVDDGTLYVATTDTVYAVG